MKFEIEDAVVGVSEIQVTVLKDGLFSRDIVVNKKRFEEYVTNGVAPREAFWRQFYRSCFFFQDLYNYIEENDLVPKDIIKFEN